MLGMIKMKITYQKKKNENEFLSKKKEEEENERGYTWDGGWAINMVAFGEIQPKQVTCSNAKQTTFTTVLSHL